MIRFFEGAGSRGMLELVGEEVLALARGGMSPERIGLVVPGYDRIRGALETVLGSFGIPYAVDGELRLTQTPLVHALAALLRFAWAGGTRGDLFSFLRSPFSGVERRAVDFVEGRLRGRAIQAPERVVEEWESLRGSPVPALAELRDAADPVEAVRELAERMLRNAYGLEHPPANAASRLDLRAYETLRRLLAELEGWRELSGELSREDVLAAVERAALTRRAGDDAGRVAVVDLLRARTRRFDAVFVLGLEEGSLPRRGAWLAVPRRRRAARARRERREARAAGSGRERPLPLLHGVHARLAAALSRARGGRRRRQPARGEPVLARRGGALRRRRRAPLDAPTAALGADLAARGRTDRARAAAGARGARRARHRRRREALARANGWERRLERALGAFNRPTRLTNPLVLEQLGSRTSFSVTELERFADCSSAWFVERFLYPRTIDAEPDAMQRGSVAHTALHRFFARVPAELGVEKLEPGHVEDAKRLMRQCLDEALGGVRMELTEMQLRELDQSLWRDLEALVEEECESGLSLVPRRFEVSFGNERAAPELQRGLELGPGLTLSGKIDRIDVDPFGARGIVQDYKSGKHAHSAAEIERELRLQVPLYMLVLRDLVGLEPLGGLYRPLAGTRRARGLVRARGGGDAARLRQERLPRRGGLLGRRRVGARDRDGAGRADPGGRRPPRPARRRLPDVVRSLADVPDRARMSAHELNEQQLTAVEAGGEVFVSAGAGTGKTAVLVERVVRAVTERGLDVDSILVITYTRRAAGELRTRIRAALAERGRHDLARELDGAWISTIHGFCARLLRAYPLAAGLDPRFRELDEAQAAVLRSEAFGEALGGVLRRRRPAAARAARHLRQRPAAADADERLRDAARGRARARPRGGTAAGAGRAGRRAARRRDRARRRSGRDGEPAAERDRAARAPRIAGSDRRSRRRPATTSRLRRQAATSTRPADEPRRLQGAR